MDQNTVKRKIATALAVCLLAASAAPAVLAEDTGCLLYTSKRRVAFEEKTLL